MTFGEIEDANAVWEILRDALLTWRVESIGPRPVAGEPELRVTLPGGRELTLVPRSGEPSGLPASALLDELVAAAVDLMSSQQAMPDDGSLRRLAQIVRDAHDQGLQAQQTTASCTCCVNNECECKGKDITWNQGGDGP